MNFSQYVSETPYDDDKLKSISFNPSENTKRVLSDTSDNKNRKKSIVSSYNVAAVIGCDPFTTAEQEFEYKVGLKKKKETQAMENGKEKEKLAAKQFSMKSGKVLFRVPVVACKENPYVCAYSDRITEDGVNVEIKVPYSQVVTEDFDLEDLKKKKPQYYHQMQLQMHVLDLQATWFVQYGGPPNVYHTVTPLNKNHKHPPREVLSALFVSRDPNWWETYHTKIEDFIKKVLLYRSIEMGLKLPSNYQE